MLNHTYHLRSTAAVRKAGGGHKLARLQGTQLELTAPPESNLIDRLPWAGIFEPWRPWVLVIAAAAECELQPKNAAIRCKSDSRRHRRLEEAGQLRFDDMSAQNFTAPQKSTPNRPPKAGKSPADSKFPPLAPITEYDADRPLADLFPEAYL